MNLSAKKTVADATSETCKMLRKCWRIRISKKAVCAVPVDGVMGQSLSLPSSSVFAWWKVPGRAQARDKAVGAGEAVAGRLVVSKVIGKRDS